MFASPLKTCPQSSATAGEPVDHPEPLEQLEGQPQRQAHHPEEVATDPLDQRRALALDRVGAGLVQRLPGRDVRGDLGVRTRSECQDGHFSRISVTGPSFTSSTSIIAPNSPVATCTPLPAPRSRMSATKRS